MALREVGGSYNTSYPESQGWLSVNVLAGHRKLGMAENRNPLDMISEIGWNGATRVASGPRLPKYR